MGTTVWPILIIAVLFGICKGDSNVGCLFSEELCMADVEWCFDDGAFGRCIKTNDPRDPRELYRHFLREEELAIIEGELQKLLELGYRWSHKHTQCLLKALLFAFENGTPLDASMCHQYKQFDLQAALAPQDENEPMAYIKFTPSAGNPQSDYADELYYPPSPDEGMQEYILESKEEEPVPPFVSRRSETHFSPAYNSPENFRSGFEVKDLLPQEEEEDDYERYQNLDRPFAALRSLASWPLPDEYESRRKQIDDFDPEKLSKSLRNILRPSFALFKAPAKNYAGNDPEEIEYELENNKGRIIQFDDDGKGYTEGGTVYQEEEDSLPDLIDKLNGALGFKRRERLDVKKPGPPYDPAFQEQKEPKEKPINKSEGEKEDIADQLPSKVDKKFEGTPKLKKKANPIRVTTTPDYEVIDTDIAYIQFEDRIRSWSEGQRILNILTKLLNLPNGTFSHLDLDHNEVAFKVNPKTAGMNASEVAEKLDNMKDKISREIGVTVVATGIGFKTAKLPTALRLTGQSEHEMYVGVIVVGALAAVVLSAVVFYMAKKHGHKLRSHVKAEGEPMRKLYQDLCRARMSTKPPAPQESAPAQRVTSLSKESDKDSPSSRSSTSSWSEEPALTNMDVATGQMVLSYMEEHLKNKERLETEWTALCAYEADPSATTIAQRPENLQKNRYPHALPYDHARVVLNELSNITGSDYINASTITDHDPRNPAYIVTQGPLPHTTPDLWQMVWEQGCVAMVMLTRLGEADSPLCYHYWPEEGSELYHVYEVHLVSEHIWCDDYLVRSFYLKNLKTGETRTVTQFHFMSWPDGGIPNSTKPLLEFRRKVNKSFRGRSCPIVVHCSDGVGRSGAYVLLDMVLNRIAKGAKEIDVAATLEHIRDQRAGAVATKQQFQFVLQAVTDEVQAILKLLPQQP